MTASADETESLAVIPNGQGPGLPVVPLGGTTTLAKASPELRR